MRVERAEHAGDGAADGLGAVHLVHVVLLDEGEDVGKGFQLPVGVAFLFALLGAGRGQEAGEQQGEQEGGPFHGAV